MNSKRRRESDDLDMDTLLNEPTAMDRKTVDTEGSDFHALLSEETAVEAMERRRFQNDGGPQIKPPCEHRTRYECARINGHPCRKTHFLPIIRPHTDPSMGDCSFLKTCRNMETCKFCHYEADPNDFADDPSLPLGVAGGEGGAGGGAGGPLAMSNIGAGGGVLAKRGKGGDKRISDDPFDIGVHSENIQPAQWINCDLRQVDFSPMKSMNVKVIMADPPWLIHMELPYGTMEDQEVLDLKIDQIHEEGLLFLWVTHRTMEHARECLKRWHYRLVDELIWVKTNQLMRIIRTGRTGHWLNHSKEHCLVAVKGNPQVNRNIDSNVLVAEVRETSRKPDEIYRIIERMCPGGYKVELFGRNHNRRNNWITFGNQLGSSHIHDERLQSMYDTANQFRQQQQRQQQAAHPPNIMNN